MTCLPGARWGLYTGKSFSLGHGRADGDAEPGFLGLLSPLPEPSSVAALSPTVPGLPTRTPAGHSVSELSQKACPNAGLSSTLL